MQHSGWSDEEAATRLALVLQGKALPVLLDPAPAEQQDLQALTIELQRRFRWRLFIDQSTQQPASCHSQEGESLGTFTAGVQLHGLHDYLQFHTAAQEELALHALLQRLPPEQLCQHVGLAMPQSLSEALRTAMPQSLHEAPSRRLPLSNHTSG